MSAIWILSEGEWAVMPLVEPRFFLRDRAVAAAVGTSARDAATAAAMLVSREKHDTWVLFAGPGMNVLVNGLPIAGIRILAHRDEVRVGRQQLYFSAERLIRPEPFAGPDGTCCARCLSPILRGDLAVRCGCNLWYHQSDSLGCWLYTDRCCGCDAPTTIDAEYSWSPEGL